MTSRLALALLGSLALAACCGPQVQALKNDPRGKLDECTHFVVLATVLEGPSASVAPASTASTATTATQNAPGADPATGIVPDDLGTSPWVYVTPCWPGVLSPEVEDAWRPPTTRGGVISGDGVDSGCPPLIRAALDAARAVLEARGLTPLTGPPPAGTRVLVVGVSVSTREEKARLVERGTITEPAATHLRLARVAIHAGSVLDGKFVRDLTSFAAVYPEECAPEEPFDDEVVRMVTKLVRAVPD
jgi:hypothetical protein